MPHKAKAKNPHGLLVIDDLDSLLLWVRAKLEDAQARQYDGQDGVFFAPTMRVWTPRGERLVHPGWALKEVGAEMAPTLNRWRLREAPAMHPVADDFGVSLRASLDHVEAELRDDVGPRDQARNGRYMDLVHRRNALRASLRKLDALTGHDFPLWHRSCEEE